MIFDLWEEREALRDVWRCVLTKNGRLSVIDGGMTEKQELYADNLDFRKTLTVKSIKTIFI